MSPSSSSSSSSGIDDNNGAAAQAHLEVALRNALINVRGLLVALGKLVRPIVKMGRLGLLIKITFSLLLSYFDIVSDLVVCVAYYSRSRHDPEMLFWFEVSLFFILTAYVATLTFVYLQYRGLRRSFVRRRVFHAGFFLSPVVEGFGVWSGSEHLSGALFHPVMMLGLLKAIEVAFESLGQGVVQCVATLGMEAETITPIFAVSLIASFATIGFSTTDANVGMDRLFARTLPGSPHHGWTPIEPRSMALYFLGMFLFLCCYCFYFVFTIASIYYYYETFLLVGVVASLELSVIFAYRIYKQDIFIPLAPHINFAADYTLGLLYHVFAYFVMSCAPMTILASPLVFGPKVFGRFVLYRYLSNAVMLFFTLPTLSRKTWLGREAAWTVVGAIFVVSLVGLAIVIHNIRDTFDKRVLFDNESTRENSRWFMFSETKIGKDQVFGDMSKEEFRFGLLLKRHPSLIYKEDAMGLLKTLVTKFCAEGGQEGEEAEGGHTNNTFRDFTDAKGTKVLRNFRYYRDAESYSVMEAYIAKLSARFVVAGEGGDKSSEKTKVAPSFRSRQKRLDGIKEKTSKEQFMKEKEKTVAREREMTNERTTAKEKTKETEVARGKGGGEGTNAETK